MLNTQHVNDVEHLYDQPVEEKKGKFVCPVCEKEYATRAGIHKHMTARDCAPASLLFKNTVTETVAYELFVEVSPEYNPRQRVSTAIFRKSRSYKAILKFALHCMTNKVNPRLYLYWLQGARKPKYFNQLFSLGMKDSNLVAFRDHLIRNQELIDSESFYEANSERLLSDDAFLVRSIERGDIGVDYCMNHTDLDLGSRIENFTDEIRIRMLAVVTVLEG